jgi:hypothetical protein
MGTTNFTQNPHMLKSTSQFPTSDLSLLSKIAIKTVYAFVVSLILNKYSSPHLTMYEFTVLPIAKKKKDTVQLVLF